MEGDNNAFTYETVFDILRKERSSESLQRLEDGFYSNVVTYIGEKTGIGDNVILYNVRKMMKEIYERREKKIVSLAIDRCRLGMESVNAVNMLKEERDIYEHLIDFLIIGRKAILENLLNGKYPHSFQRDTSIQTDSKPVIPNLNRKEEQKPSNLLLDTKTEEETPESNSIMLRFIHAVPRFVGKELEIYGPYEVEDMANVPAEIAHLLIAKGRAEEIKGK